MKKIISQEEFKEIYFIYRDDNTFIIKNDWNVINFDFSQINFSKLKAKHFYQIIKLNRF